MIRILHHTPRHRVKVAGTIDTDVTEPGELTVSTGTHGATKAKMSLYDGILEAQDIYGLMTWTIGGSAREHGIARGRYPNVERGGDNRVVVIDTDNADGNDIIEAIIWVYVAEED